ncbi:MAG: SDR family NAD(P)-dependent oxidoreductase [Rhodospirillaceae bacterium]|nr:SDR family NAD(P)-dependent oxidoreductase [Rhodospirillaceae bacterium]
MSAKNKKILVTGAAGFIGAAVAERLLAAGHVVSAIDNFNSYYDVALKEARWARLAAHTNFRGTRVDLADKPLTFAAFDNAEPTHVIHLAAQAGVRYGMENPQAYVDSNLTGFMNVLEAARAHQVAHLVFASSSSVYGANRTTPFAENHSADHPISLYAATKRANELLAHTYAHLFKIPCTGLRFFTVYGPWGRPDMAPYKFTARILSGQAIDVHHDGNMRRDFTYIDDIVEGVVRLIDHIPVPDDAWNAFNPTPDGSAVAAFRLFNIGRGEPVELMDFIRLIEKHAGTKAQLNHVPIQPGEVEGTWCDVTALERAVGYRPKVSLDEGLAKTVAWFRAYHKV